jgi:serine/threonine protein kinase
MLFGPLVIILVSGLPLHANATCFLWSEKPEEYGEIARTIKQVSSSYRLKQLMNSPHLLQRSFSYRELFDMCPVPFAEAVMATVSPESDFLGKGAFGTVFAVNVKGVSKAVKKISPKKIIERKLRKLLHIEDDDKAPEQMDKLFGHSDMSNKPSRTIFHENASLQESPELFASEQSKGRSSILPEQTYTTSSPHHETQQKVSCLQRQKYEAYIEIQNKEANIQSKTPESMKTCLSSILDKLNDPRIFLSDKDGVRRDFKKQLRVMHFEDYFPKECQIEDSLIKQIVLIVNKTFEALTSELEVSEVFSKYSQENEQGSIHKTFPSLDYCIIGKKLDVFIVGEKLGNSLVEMRKSCAVSIKGNDFKTRLVTYINMLYQVYLVNQKGYCHCDIKLENLLYSQRDFTKVHLIDFGHAKYQTRCRGGTAGYKPPEMYVAEIFVGEYDSLSGTPEYLKHDVFSAGIAILMLELSYESATKIFTTTHRMEKLTIDTIEREFLEFEQFTHVAFSMEYNSRYSDTVSQSSLTAKLDMELGAVITQMTLFFPSIRIALSPALFLMYKIYVALVENDHELNLYDDYLQQPEKTRAEIEAGDWLEKVQELLQVRPKKQLI